MLRTGTFLRVALVAGLISISPQSSAAASGIGFCVKKGQSTNCFGKVELPPVPGAGNQGGGGTASGEGNVGAGETTATGVKYTPPTADERFKAIANTCAGKTTQLFCQGIGVMDFGKYGGIGLGIDPFTGLPILSSIPLPAVGAGPAAQPHPPPPPSPAEVAQVAYAKITLPKPTIGSAPCTRADCKGAVGLPVWLWTDPRNWTPQTASASLGGVTVNVNAKLRAVTWSMGDGSKVTCTTPGTEYHTSMGFNSSPDCGHKYLRTSLKQPGGRYTVQAIASYDVVFSGAFKATLNPTTSSTTTVAITEYQAIVER